MKKFLLLLALLMPLFAFGQGSTPIATVDRTGKVKPDGITITITEDGTISSSGGGGGPTNGTTAAGVTNIVNANAILQQGGTGTNNVLGSLTILNGSYKNFYLPNGDFLRTNTIAPFDWYRHRTNGLAQYGTNTVVQFAFDMNTGASSTKSFSVLSTSPGTGKTNFLFSTSPLGTLGTNDMATFIASLWNPPGLIIAGSVTNNSLTASTVLAADANKKVVSIANGLGALTNDASGNFGYTPLLDASALKASQYVATDASTNLVSTRNAGSPGWTNLVAVPASAHTNVVMEKPDGSMIPYDLATLLSNGGGGGGSAFPLVADANFGGFSGTNIQSLLFHTNFSGNNVDFELRYDATVLPGALRLFPRADLLYAGFNANTIIAQGNGTGGNYEGAVIATNAGVFSKMDSNSVTTGTGAFTLGSISLIPTNAAVIYTSNGVAPSLPFGITNVLAGRAQPVVRYYVVDAVTGVPILTFSNETSGIKLTVSDGALALIQTNFAVLPITSTNTIWRVRDESTGSGASVGILTNWFIGL